MKSLLLLTITIASHLTLGQGYSQYKEIDFPKGKFLTKIDQRTLGTITVELIQVKPITNDPSLPDCLTWLTIREGDKVIKELNKGILAVGGCSGFYFPPRQPNKSLIVISKFGDYDGGIITIDNQGQFTEKMGGTFYVSPDGKYLFSNYYSDLKGVTIIDTTENKIIFSGQFKYYLADWYFENNQYFAMISEDVIPEAGTGKLIFDFIKGEFREERTKTKIDLKNRLAVYNDFSNSDCNCGQ